MSLIPKINGLGIIGSLAGKIWGIIKALKHAFLTGFQVLCDAIQHGD